MYPHLSFGFYKDIRKIFLKIEYVPPSDNVSPFGKYLVTNYGNYADICDDPFTYVTLTIDETENDTPIFTYLTLANASCCPPTLTGEVEPKCVYLFSNLYSGSLKVPLDIEEIPVAVIKLFELVKHSKLVIPNHQNRSWYSWFMNLFL